jgi:hypothetical protein
MERFWGSSTPPGAVAHRDCVDHFYTIARELRGQYDMAAE